MRVCACASTHTRARARVCMFMCLSKYVRDVCACVFHKNSSLACVRAW